MDIVTDFRGNTFVTMRQEGGRREEGRGEVDLTKVKKEEKGRGEKDKKKVKLSHQDLGEGSSTRVKKGKELNQASSESESESDSDSKDSDRAEDWLKKIIILQKAMKGKKKKKKNSVCRSQEGEGEDSEGQEGISRKES